MKLDLGGFQGYVKKTATVSSNDPLRPRVTLLVEGNVKPLIEVRPEKAVYFQGLADNLTEKVIDLIGTSQPFHVTKMDDNLDKKAAYRLETVEDGKHYRLRISNRLQRGNYRGAINIHTDFAKKPELAVWVNGSVEGEIGIRPNTLIVGRLSADQAVLSGKVLVTNNRNKAFQIVKYTYDEKIIQVSRAPFPNEPGFSLEVTPILNNIPLGGRLQTKLIIETDVATEGKYEVQIQAINLPDSPK